MRTISILIALLLVIGCSTPASAQTPADSVFVCQTDYCYYSTNGYMIYEVLRLGMVYATGIELSGGVWTWYITADAALAANPGAYLTTGDWQEDITEWLIDLHARCDGGRCAE
jgi:hypothetical protein